jgi:hypothetical protein
VNTRTIVAILLLFAGASSICVAQGKKRIERADDLPRFSYPVTGSVEQLVRDDARFAAFAAPLRRDVESVLAGYEIADKSVERQLLAVLWQLDWLEGKPENALVRAEQIRALQEKPADKLLSGMQVRAMVAARRSAGGESARRTGVRSPRHRGIAQVDAVRRDRQPDQGHEGRVRDARRNHPARRGRARFCSPSSTRPAR